MTRLRTRLIGRIASFLACSLLTGSVLRMALADEAFTRGDVNRNGVLELTDAVALFGYLFLGDGAPPCLDAADANDDGSLDVSDGVSGLVYLFAGGPAPRLPYPERGIDPTPDTLDCERYASCPTLTNSVGMRLVSIEPGSFLMGSPIEERDRWFNEGPVHRVRITRRFYIGVTEVTQGQYLSVMGVNPSYFQGPLYGTDLDRPVEQVNVADVEEFCVRLSALEGKPYRLPTEAQWEYAARAGTTTRFHFGDALECPEGCSPCASADRYLWWCGNDGVWGTERVGSKAPNAWCLHDMNGSVWEWCRNWTSRYTADEAVDPTGPEEGEERIIRGGHWGLGLGFCRSAMRGDLSTEHRYEHIGFRVVLEDPDHE